MEAGHSNAPPSWQPLDELMPYLWPPGRPDLRWRVIVSIFLLVLTPIVTVATPYFFGLAVDGLKGNPADIALAAPIALIVSYGVAWILSQAVAQLRDGIFAKVCYHALRVIAVETFHHLHALSLRFHLQRHTGGLSRIIDRGTKAIDRILTLAIFNIFPTALQLIFICALLWIRLNVWFTVITVLMIAAYSYFTFAVTRWRMHIRRAMNDSDNEANTKAVDSLLNYETVKYFNAELHEERRAVEIVRGAFLEQEHPQQADDEHEERGHPEHGIGRLEPPRGHDAELTPDQHELDRHRGDQRERR